MAWPWLTIAVKTIPWGAIVRQTPDVIDAAGRLLATRKVTQTATRDAARSEGQLDEIRERLGYLEEHDRDTAEVVNQIARQTRDMANGLEVLAAKVRVLTVCLAAIVVLALGAIAIAIQ